MEPLSLKTRRVVAALFFILFAVVLFAASVYASGYRISGFSFLRTGGIHVSVPISGAQVRIDSKLAGTSGFLSRSFFIDNLTPKSYAIEVAAPGFHPWTKTVIVEPAFVSDISAFMVPVRLVLVPVVVASSTVPTATTTRAVSPAEYALIVALFEEATTTTPVATSSSEIGDVPGVESAVGLILRDGNVFVRWRRPLVQPPQSFCVTPRACVVEITVENGEADAAQAEFFKDGVVYSARNAGVFFAEVDVKQPRLVVPLLELPGAEFRIVQDEVIVKNGEKLFAVSGI